MESIIGSGELEVTARPVQILAVDEQCRLVTKCLEHFEYLLADVTIPIHIINIIGDHFSGKSFLMNLLINYLKNDCKGLKGDVESSFKVSGKKFGRKYRPFNVVRAYPEIFIQNSPNGLYGIMLMDTQGLFDGKHSNLVPVLFKICKTLSSVTILNVTDGQLLNKTLQNVVNHSDDKIPNNTDLMLLMRDQTKQGEIPFSVSDLSALIQGDSFNDETINELRSKFKNVSCFSLAKPSKVCLRNQFRVDIQKLSPQFVKAVNCLFAQITAVGDINLLLTGNQLLTLFRTVSSSDSIKWKILSKGYLEIMKSKSSQIPHVVSSTQGSSSVKGADEPRIMVERAVSIIPAGRSNVRQRQSSSIAADIKPLTSSSSTNEPGSSSVTGADERRRMVERTVLDTLAGRFKVGQRQCSSIAAAVKPLNSSSSTNEQGSSSVTGADERRRMVERTVLDTLAGQSNVGQRQCSSIAVDVKPLTSSSSINEPGSSSLKGADEPRRMVERAVPITPAGRFNVGQRQSSSNAADVKPSTSSSSISESGSSSLKGANEPRRMVERAVPVASAGRSNVGQRQSSNIAADVKPSTSNSSITEPGSSSLKGVDVPRRMVERTVPITPAERSDVGQRQCSSIAADIMPSTSSSSNTEPLQEARSYNALKRECRDRLFERMYGIQDVLDLIELEVDIIRQYWPVNYTNITEKYALQRDLKRLVVEKAMDILKSNCERKMKTDIDDSMLPTLADNFRKIFIKIKDESVCKMRKLDPSSVEHLTTELSIIEAHYKAKNEKKWTNVKYGAGAAAAIGTGLYMLSGNKKKEKESRQQSLFNSQPVDSAGGGWGALLGGIGALASMMSDASKNPRLNN